MLVTNHMSTTLAMFVYKQTIEH